MIKRAMTTGLILIAVTVGLFAGWNALKGWGDGIIERSVTSEIVSAEVTDFTPKEVRTRAGSYTKYHIGFTYDGKHYYSDDLEYGSPDSRQIERSLAIGDSVNVRNDNGELFFEGPARDAAQFPYMMMGPLVWFAILCWVFAIIEFSVALPSSSNSRGSTPNTSQMTTV